MPSVRRASAVEAVAWSWSGDDRRVEQERTWHARLANEPNPKIDTCLSLLNSYIQRALWQYICAGGINNLLSNDWMERRQLRVDTQNERNEIILNKLQNELLYYNRIEFER